jgi:hypothetical protein
MNLSGINWNPRKSEKLAIKYFSGLSDQERTEAIVQWMYERPGDSPYIGNEITQLFINDPFLIQESSHLRSLMGKENDPRRIFILSQFSNRFLKHGENFIVETSKFLFQNGRVAENTSTFPAPVDDLGHYAYYAITEELKYLKASFNEEEIMPHQGMIPIEQKIPILAKWLKENWPGCEDLEIPADVFKPMGTTRPTLRPDLPSSERKQPPGSETEANSKDSRVVWPWIVSALVSLAAAFTFLKFRR